MSKTIAEHSNALSIFWLKKHDFLNRRYSYRSGGVTWKYGYSENKKNNISYYINRDNWGTPGEKAYLNLIYTYTDPWTNDKEDMNYKIELTTTPCHYGGKRYWFLCPLTKNGKYCGRRVGVLYSVGKWFGCRHCGEIAYAAQMKGGRYRTSSVSCPDIEQAEAEIKRYYYNGKPTRKYKRLIHLNNKLQKDIMKIATY